MIFDKKAILFLFLSLVCFTGIAQQTFPVNGVSDKRTMTYAFTNATIFKDARIMLQNATLLITGTKIIAVGPRVNIPGDAIVIDCKGKFIYPSFIDLYSDYGIPVPQRSGTPTGAIE